jgi:hypothetical protein
MKEPGERDNSISKSCSTKYTRKEIEEAIPDKSAQGSACPGQQIR